MAFATALLLLSLAALALLLTLALLVVRIRRALVAAPLRLLAGLTVCGPVRSAERDAPSRVTVR
ncbi:MAG TPA: hypothetical protein VFI92_00155 [Steroidobacteraceae bacterium]|nr:hypothetical protein [Steroidobacteraceae bacterium]